MRSRALSAVLALSAATTLGALGTGCATRSQPYRFSSPLLGAADVPGAPLPGTDPSRPPGDTSAAPSAIASRRAPPRRAGGWQADAQQGAIRTVSARGIEAKTPVASADAASAITSERYAQQVVWSRLPAPHRGGSALAALPAQPGGLTGAIELPRVREPADLRGFVGQRDSRDPLAIVLAWLADLGIATESYPSEGPALVTWAQTAGKLALVSDAARPGDLLVFDRATTDGPSDLFALVIARDARGVVEFMYAGHGVIRRGFLDPTRPSIRRDADGAIVNTFLRHGKQWPPAGTRYLAGELVAHVIHTR